MIPDFDTCYRALQARAARFDGLFFVGVSTTGIYCRPVFPARKAKAASGTLFAVAAAAEEAGFRPCLRCRPELAPSESFACQFGKKISTPTPCLDQINALAEKWRLWRAYATLYLWQSLT